MGIIMGENHCLDPLLRPVRPRAALGIGAPLLSLLGFGLLGFIRGYSAECLQLGPRRNLDAAPAHRIRQPRHGVVQANHARHEHFHRRNARRLGPVRGIQPVLRRAHFRVQLRRVELAQVPNALNTLFVMRLIIQLRNAGLDPALVVVARERHVGGNDERGVRHRRNNVGPQV